MGRIEVPFTADQVDALNAYQRCGVTHPFTCPALIHRVRRPGEPRVLVATPAGWVCPECDYAQGWAHDYMADPRWIPLAQTTSAREDVDAGLNLVHLKAVRAAVVTLADGDASLAERIAEAEKLAAVFGLPLELEGEDDGEDEP